MKRNYLFAIAALGMLAGCAKGPEQVPEPEQVVDDTTREAVTLGISSPKIEVTKTKAMGPISQWNEQELHIYCIDRSQLANLTQSTSYLIDNVVVPAPTVESGLIKPMNGKDTYYYGPNNTLYDFFGYFVDDMKVDGLVPTPSKSADKITLPVHITGGEDIMLAKADPAKDVIGAGAPMPQHPERAYSAYSARRSVIPTLRFEHQLARFNFKVILGKGSKSNVKVNEIKLASKTEATLNIVAPEGQLGLVDPVQEYVMLSLMERDEAGQLRAFTPFAPVDSETPVEIGAGIMVIPGETKYDLEVYMSGTTNTEGEDIQQEMSPLKVTLNASDLSAEKFEAGKQYDITIKVYGLEEIQITAELAPWENGGNTTIDPDIWPGDDVVTTKELSYSNVPSVVGSEPQGDSYKIVIVTLEENLLPQVGDAVTVDGQPLNSETAYRITVAGEPQAKEYDLVVSAESKVKSFSEVIK